MQLSLTAETIENLLYLENEPILELKISYPQIMGPLSKTAEFQFNNHYKDLARRWNARGRTEFYHLAGEDAKIAKAQEYSFTLHSFIRSFSVPRLEKRFCSVLTDQYRFVGGMHGLTVRKADLWDFRLKRKIPITSLFTSATAFQRIFLAEIEKRILVQKEKEEILFFENPLKNARQCFRVQNCYLTNDSVAVFYPLYTLAPYYAGILTYETPLDTFDGCWKTNCRPENAANPNGCITSSFAGTLL